VELVKYAGRVLHCVGWGFAAVLLPCCLAAHAQVRVVVDQVGYEASADKIGIVEGTRQTNPTTFELIDDTSGGVVFKGPCVSAGDVYNWGGRSFWIADFSSWRERGHYMLRTSIDGKPVQSSMFEIDTDVLERRTLSNVLFYFKGQRASGSLDEADRHLAVPGKPGEFVDLHGGWYDATGDYGIHLSHQNPTSFFNPQQVPLVAWSLLKSYDALKSRGQDNFIEYERRLLDEGLYGADFLVRMKRPSGSFFESIDGPGKNKLAADRAVGNPNWRTQIKTKATDATERMDKADGAHAYESSFRAGGGMAIAALALASTMPSHGDFDQHRYLAEAESAFDFLSAHNRELLNDGVENILDDYCALLAATEIYRASKDEKYRSAADTRAEQLMLRLTSVGQWHDYWRADDKTRPYFHPADAGMPVISLVEYFSIADAARQSQVRDVVKRSLQFELDVTGEVANPFGYARQLVRMGDGAVRAAFFFPHDSEAAPWWQGEDARLASLSAAARVALPLFREDHAFESQLNKYAWNQLHWILGRNPFDTSMLMGSGHGDAAYMFFRSYQYTNAPGAIVNGITAGLKDEDGIAFNQGFAVTGLDEDWRWTEEWLPHAAWYLYAVSLPHE
jgi:hypothetical protein